VNHLLLRLLLCLSAFIVAGGNVDAMSLQTAGQYYSEGARLRGIGLFNRSRGCMNMAIRLDPDGPVGKAAEQYIVTYLPKFPVPDEAQDLNNRAYRLDHENKREAAKALYEQCIRLHPFFERPYNNLALIYWHENDFNHAEKLLRKAIDITPTYVNAWITLGYIKWKQNDIKEARRCYGRALTLDPGNEEAKEQLRLHR